MKNTKLAKNLTQRPLKIDTKQKNAELTSCQFDKTYLLFLERLISGKKTNDDYKFIKIGRQKGMRVARPQLVQGYVKRVSRSKTNKKTITAITPKELLRVINENSGASLAKQTASFSLQQVKETRGNVFNTELDRSGFYYTMSKILPNYESDAANPTSSLTIFLPRTKESRNISEWRLYELEGITPLSSEPSKEQLASNLRLALFMGLLDQINTNLTAKNFQKITYNAISELLYSLEATKNKELILSEDVKNSFFTGYLNFEKKYKENRKLKTPSETQSETENNITADNIELAIPVVPDIDPPPPEMKATILHSTQTQNRTLHDLEFELDTHEANASQSICYFLAALSGVIVNIKLPRSSEGPCENIIVAPTIFSDTVKQTQLFLNVDHSKMLHLKKIINKGRKKPSYRIILNAKSTTAKRNLQRKQRSVMTAISESIYNAEVIAKGEYIATPSKNTVVYPPYAPDPRRSKQSDTPW